MGESYASSSVFPSTHHASPLVAPPAPPVSPPQTSAPILFYHSMPTTGFPRPPVIFPPTPPLLPPPTSFPPPSTIWSNAAFPPHYTIIQIPYLSRLKPQLKFLICTNHRGPAHFPSSLSVSNPPSSPPLNPPGSSAIRPLSRTRVPFFPPALGPRVAILPPSPGHFPGF